MSPETKIIAYIQEINVITNSWLSEVIYYSKYRSMGVGFNRNVYWLKDSDVATISFFNGVTDMLDLAFVMSIWKMTERLKGKLDGNRPGEMFVGVTNSKRRKHDEIRSLPRAAFLFRDALDFDKDFYTKRYAERQKEISIEMKISMPEMNHYVDKIAKDREALLDICKIIDSFESSKEYENLDIIRNQGFAHSSEISRKSITSNLEPEAIDFKRAELFKFGDHVMQTALNFAAIWYQRWHHPVEDLIKQNTASSSVFWEKAKLGLMHTSC
jgi:hypothetical protein